MKPSRLAAAAVPAFAAAAFAQVDHLHLMQIEQVIAGVNGDTAAQAIQLRMRAAGQQFVGDNGRILAFDAAGLNQVDIIVFPSSPPNGQLGDRVLIATAAFSDHTDPPAVPDFIMTNPIPLSSLNAGRILFGIGTNTNGIYWSLAWGGSAYTGSHRGATFNDIDGNFGPAFPGALPRDGVEALRFQGPANALSTTNAADYALTTGAAVFTNNARENFTVVASQPCYADCDTGTGPNVLDIFDFLCFQNRYATNDPYACDCDTATGPGLCDIFDFLCFQNAYAAGCP